MAKFYAVHNGRNPGIYKSWDECKTQVNGFSGSVFKSFKTESEARDFFRDGYGSSCNSVKANMSAPTSKQKSASHMGLQGSGGIKRKADWGCEGQGSSKMTYGMKSYHEETMSVLVPTFERKREAGSRNQASKEVKQIAGSSTGRSHAKQMKVQEVDNDKVTIKKFTFTADEDKYPIVFTDGACSNNGKKSKNVRAGYGVYWGDKHPLNLSRRLDGIQTNQRAEIAAINACLEQAKDHGIPNLTVKTDSKFVIDCMTKWAPRWSKNNWVKSDGKPVVHKKELTKMLDSIKHVNVKWEHVRSHKGTHGNEMADRLAVAGSQL